MNPSPDMATWLIELVRQGVFLALIVAAPPVLAALAVGFVISVLQAVTHIAEPGLSFAPKVVAATAAVVVSGPWIGRRLTEFTLVLLAYIPELGRG